MELEDLPPDIQFSFIAIMQSAILFKEQDRDEKEFLNFCKGIWESMELTDLETLKDIISGKMRKDVETSMEKYHSKKNKKGI